MRFAKRIGWGGVCAAVALTAAAPAWAPAWTPAWAHSGGTDARGCHVERSSGGAHCHAQSFEKWLTPEEVRFLQRALQGFGHYQGPLDGKFADATLIGVKTWLRAQGMIDPEPPTDRSRDAWVTEDEVRALQVNLRDELPPEERYTGRIDGKFGPKTLGALRNYFDSQRVLVE